MSRPGFEPRTFLLWGNNANHWATMLKTQMKNVTYLCSACSPKEEMILSGFLLKGGALMGDFGGLLTRWSVCHTSESITKAAVAFWDVLWFCLVTVSEDSFIQGTTKMSINIRWYFSRVQTYLSIICIERKYLRWISNGLTCKYQCLQVNVKMFCLFWSWNLLRYVLSTKLKKKSRMEQTALCCMLGEMNICSIQIQWMF